MKVIILLLLIASISIQVSILGLINNNAPDRSPQLKYPSSGLIVDSVYVYLSKGYAYHNSRTCRTEPQLLGVNKDSAISMTEYEAILRGFFECPDCTDRIEH